MEEKNHLLKEMVEFFGLQESIIRRSHREFIFAVNAKNPEPVDHETVGELKKRILAECPPRTISIPISYHAVELTLKEMAKEMHHIAFTESAILKELTNYRFTGQSSLKDALRYLHEKNLIFYYEEAGRVIGEPQAIFNKHSQIVVYHTELSAYRIERLEKLHEIWCRFVKFGILTIRCLEKFPDHYVEGVFSPADMMKLFVKLLLVSELSDGEYFMPCVLKADPLTSCNPEPGTQSLPPMVLHFQGGPVRFGVFCGTICHLMTRSNWKLLMDPKVADQPFHITRNSIHFTLPGCRGKVTVNDSFFTFFVVTIHVPTDVPAHSESVSRMCMEVRDALLKAIAEVTEKLNYSPDTPTVAFLCEGKHDSSPSHPAVVSSFGMELLCTMVGNTLGGSLTAAHKVWLRGKL